MKKIFFIVIFLFNISILNAKVFLISENSFACKDFVKGLKISGVSFAKNINIANTILTCGNVDFKKIFKKNLPVYSVLAYLCDKKDKLQMVLLKLPSINDQIKLIDKSTGKKNIYGILLSSKNKIKYIKSLKLKNLKLYKINSFSEIPYKIDKALKECNIILLYPDKFLKNKLILQFIIKKIILSGKSYIAYSKKFLELGAKGVIITDYFKEGKRFADIINSKRRDVKILTPKFFKFITNKN